MLGLTATAPSRLREFNWCHRPGGPSGGQFCSGAGNKAPQGALPFGDDLQSHVEQRDREGGLFGRPILTGDVVSMKRVKKDDRGINESYTVRLEDGKGVRRKAIFKPESGEHWTEEVNNSPLLMTLGSPYIVPTVTNRKLSLAAREKLAYEVDATLGLGVVPETRMLTHRGKTGSIQRWVEDTVPYAEEQYQGHYASDEQLYRVALLDLVIGNADRHGGNLLFRQKQGSTVGRDLQGQLIAIDNGFAFGDSGEGSPQAPPSSPMGYWRGRSGAIREIRGRGIGIPEALRKSTLERLERWDVEAFIARNPFSPSEAQALRLRKKFVESRLRAAAKDPEALAKTLRSKLSVQSRAGWT